MSRNAVTSPRLALAAIGRRCPRCGERRIWRGWATLTETCPRCDLVFDRHGWVAAVWLNTWITILAVMGWTVVGLAITLPDVPWLITVGAVTIAVGVPVLCLPAVKLLQTGVLLRWDPPPDRMQP